MGEHVDTNETQISSRDTAYPGDVSQNERFFNLNLGKILKTHLFQEMLRLQDFWYMTQTDCFGYVIVMGIWLWLKALPRED